MIHCTKTFVITCLAMLLTGIQSVRAQSLDLLIQNQRIVADTFFFDLYLQSTNQYNIYLQNSDFVLEYNTVNFQNLGFGYVANTSSLKNSLGQTISYGNNLATQIGTGYNDGTVIINVIKYVGTQADFDNTVAVIDSSSTNKLGTFYMKSIINPSLSAGFAWVTSSDRGVPTTIYTMATTSPFAGTPAIINNAQDPTPTAAPTQNSDSITFANVVQTSMSLYIGSTGNGAKRLILARQDSAIGTNYPADGVAYTASSVFGQGSEIGTSETYIVYDGTGDTVHITGLTSGKTYYFAVFEYNGENGSTENYLTPGATASQATDAGYVTFSIKVFLGGPFNTNTGLMNTSLNSGNKLPKSAANPTAYGKTPWNYTSQVYGEDSVASIPNANVVDWILVELRTGTSSSTKAYTKAGFLLKDGRIVGMDGVTDLQFTIANPTSYYIVIYHRNHLPIMSNALISKSNNTFTKDFTTSLTSAYKNTQDPLTTKTVSGNSVYTMIPGDANSNKNVRWSGAAADRTTLLSTVGALTPTKIVSGYLSADLNMDGVVRWSGANADRTVLLGIIGSLTPTRIYTSQVP